MLALVASFVLDGDVTHGLASIYELGQTLALEGVPRFGLRCVMNLI
jgi:hypothetical protein